VQLSLLFDLYDLKIFRSNIELTIRLFQSLGIASVVLSLIYYLFPDLIIGRGIFFISLILMGMIIVLWRLLYNHLLRTKNLDQRILIVGTGTLAKTLQRISLKRQIRF
jgi:FlaA1/EpsC-like NDP-sugar epimerase